MKKKILSLIFALMLPGVVLFTACKHDHEKDGSWKYNETHHWQGCTKKNCDEKLFEDNHSFVDTTDKDIPATELETGKDYKACSVCGYETYDVIPVVEHTHTFELDWTYDEQFHWHKSKCEHIYEIEGKAEHNSLATPSRTDVPATYDSTGIDYKKCSVCKYEWSEIIPKTPKAEPVVSLFLDSKIYDSAAVVLSQTNYGVSEGAGSVSIRWYKKGETIPLEESPVNAGEYEVEFVIAEGPTKKAANIKKDFVIEKREVTSLSVEFPYSGNAIATCKNTDANVTTTGIVVGDIVDFKLTFAGKNVGYALSGVEMGTFGQSANYTVKREDVSASIVKRVLSNADFEFEYNGSTKFEIELNESNVDNIVSGETLLLEVGFGSKTVGSINQTQTLKNNQTFLAENYSLANEEVSAIIVKKVLTFEANFEYAGSSVFVKEIDHTMIADIVEGESIRVTFTFSGKNVGSNLVSVEIDQSVLNYQNYSLNVADTSVSIVPKVLKNVSLVDEYDGTVEREIVVTTVHNLVEDDVVFAELTLETANVGTSVSSVELEGVDAGNYTLALQDVTVQIIKNQNPIIVGESSIVLVLAEFGKELLLETANVQSVVDADNIVMELYETIDCDGDPIESNAIGLFYAKIYNTESSNYVADSEVIEVTLKDVPNITLKTTSKVYDKTPQLFAEGLDYEISEGAGSVDFRWYVKGSNTPLAYYPSNAGQYEVEFVIAEGTSQVARNIKKDFIIERRILTSVSLTSVYDRTSTHAVGLESYVLVGDEVIANVTVSSSCGFGGMYYENAITGKNLVGVTLTGASANNYILETSEVTLVILKKQITQLTNMLYEYEYNNSKEFDIIIRNDCSEDIIDTFEGIKLKIVFESVNAGSAVSNIIVDESSYPSSCYRIDFDNLNIQGTIQIIQNTNPITATKTKVELSSLQYSAETVRTLSGIKSIAGDVTDGLYTSDQCTPETLVEGEPLGGTYYYKFACVETANYVADYVVIEVELKKLYASIVFISTSKEYNRQAVSFVQGVDFTVSGATGDVSVLWYNRGSSTPLATAPTAVGEYDVEIVVAETDENLATRKKSAYTITQKQITSIVCDIQFEYSGNRVFKISLTSEHSTDIFDGDTVVVNITFASENAGSAISAIEVHSVESPSYCIIDLNDLEIDGQISIIKKQGALVLVRTEVEIVINPSASAIKNNYAYRDIFTNCGFDYDASTTSYKKEMYTDAECTIVAPKHLEVGTVYYYKIWCEESTNIMANFVIIEVTPVLE